MKKRFLTFLLSICFFLPYMFAITGCTSGGNPHTHSWNSLLSHDRQHHYYECSGCDEVKDSQEHDFETLNNGICFVCGFNLDHDCSMFIGTQYGYDADNHYFKCTYCKENVLSTAEAHEFNMDTCTICGYVDPNYVASSAPAVSKIHDLRIITREFYTLIVFPDGKVALIDPYLTEANGALSDMYSMLPNNDKNNNGLPEIDYLIFTSPSYVPSDGFAYWSDLEILNIYRPNIGFDPELVMMSEYTSYYYEGEEFTCEDLKNVPEYLTTGVELPYFDDYVETCPSPINQEGRYNLSTVYVAALYFADLHGINVVPIKPENNIHNKFSYLGKEYSYSLDFLDLGIQFNASESAFHFMVKDGYNSPDDVYIDTNKYLYDQYVEYANLFTVTYNDFKMLYMCESSLNILNTFNEKYKDLDVDLFVFAYAHTYEIGSANITDTFYVEMADFVDNVFDKTNNENNVLLVNPYYWGQLFSSRIETYFYYEDYKTVPAVKGDNYQISYISDSSSAKNNVRTACYRVNRYGEKTFEKWNFYSQNQLPTHWDDWQ